MDQLTKTAFYELETLCPGGVQQNVDLSSISQWRIGGPADLLLCPSSTAELMALMRWFAQHDIRPLVIGQTSNLLFDDAGVRAPLIQIGSRMRGMEIKDQQAWIQAGVWVPIVARRLMQFGLGGAEHISGIPGTLGGLICMNGGSQRKGIASIITEVESVDYSGNFRTRTVQDCSFAYRRSIFQNNGEIISAATLRLRPRMRADIRADMRAILAERRRKFPRKEPNCGSVFRSNPAMYAEFGPPGAVIERLGFKGRTLGGAQVSLRHANFIVNNGGARAVDVLGLIHQISCAVFDNTGQRLEAEVVFVSSQGKMIVADQAAQLSFIREEVRR
ncbi:UDP-N-acetylmuramate dehydrogenase [bacterium]|nr:UDP-N-acetylmuramate dehydrogenase [bacterium]